MLVVYSWLVVYSSLCVMCLIIFGTVYPLHEKIMSNCIISNYLNKQFRHLVVYLGSVISYGLDMCTLVLYVYVQ